MAAILGGTMLASVLLIISAFVQENAGAFSVVKPSELQVYADTSFDSRITKTFMKKP